MRRIFAIIILLCITYFIGGWLAVHFGVLNKDTYFSFAGVVGGLASVVGLFSFTKPNLTKNDLQEIEIDSIKSIAKTAEELEELEVAREKTEEELGDLKLQKKEMELLVKKASLTLFLKEQNSHHEKKILTEIENNETLKESLSEIGELQEKLSVLEKEIEADPNVDLLHEIMASATRKQSSNIDQAINELPPITKTFFFMIRGLAGAVTDTIRTIK